MTIQPVLTTTTKTEPWRHGRFWRILFIVIIVWLGGTAVYLAAMLVRCTNLGIYRCVR
jgi:hypothetical protein